MLALAANKTAFELWSVLSSKERKDPDIYDRLIQLITNQAHINFRFALILLNTADREIITDAVPLLKHILSNETEKDLLNKIIRPTGKLQMETLTDNIAEFISYKGQISLLPFPKL